VSSSYYEILGVSSTATSAEIKSAYKRLALQFHPDRNQGNSEAEEKFKQINIAYQTLSDTSARMRYDAYRNYESFYQSATYTRNAEYTYTHPPDTESTSPSNPAAAPTESDFQYALRWIIGFFVVVIIAVTGYYSIQAWRVSDRIEKTIIAKNELLRQAQIYESQMRYEEAIIHLDSLLRITAGYNEVFAYRQALLEKMLAEADKLFDRQKYAEALRIWQIANQSQQGKYDLYMRIASCYERLNQPEQALHIYHLLTNRYEQFLEPYYRKALVFAELKQDKEALAVCDSAVKILAQEYTNKYGEAYPILIEPNIFSEIHLKVFCMRARTHHQLNNTRRAVNDCDWAIQLFPNRPEPYLLKGKILHDVKQEGFCQEWKKAEKLGSTVAAKFREQFCR